MFGANTTVALSASRLWASNSFAGTLTTFGAFDLSLSGQAFSGTVQHNSRLLTLGGTGAYTGIINLNAGTLRINHPASSVQGTVNAFTSTNVTLTNGMWTGVLSVRSNSVRVTASTVFGGNITQSAGGAVTLAGPGPFGGAVFLNGGGANALRVSSGCVLIGAVVTIADATVTLEPGASCPTGLTAEDAVLTVNLLSGTFAGSLTQQTGGALIVTGRGNFTGPIYLNGFMADHALNISGPSVSAVYVNQQSRVFVISGSLDTVYLQQSLNLRNSVPISLTVIDMPTGTLSLSGPASVYLTMTSTAASPKTVGVDAGVTLDGVLTRSSGPLTITLGANAVFSGALFTSSPVTWLAPPGINAQLSSAARITLSSPTTLGFTGVTVSSGVQIAGSTPTLSLSRAVFLSGVTFPPTTTIGELRSCIPTTS